jgi:hypothetical protein
VREMIYPIDVPSKLGNLDSGINGRAAMQDQ